MKTQHVSLRQIVEGIELRKGSEGGGPTRTNEVRERHEGHVNRSRGIAFNVEKTKSTSYTGLNKGTKT